MLIIQLIAFAAVAVWGFGYYLRNTEAPQKPPEGSTEETPPEPPRMDRAKLEKAARDCLTASGCKFDTYYYTRNKTDLELMEIIKEYNLNK